MRTYRNEADQSLANDVAPSSSRGDNILSNTLENADAGNRRNAREVESSSLGGEAVAIGLAALADHFQELSCLLMAL